MAARKNRASTTGSMPEGWKKRISAGVIADRLDKVSLGHLVMDAAQIRATTALFDRLEPTLARTEHTGKDGGPVEHKDVTESDQEILKRFKEGK